MNHFYNLLIKTEYSLSEKAFIISFGALIKRLAALFAIIYLSYNLSKDIYGSYRQVGLLFNTLIPIISIGIPVSINYFIPLLNDNQRKSFVVQTYILLCILGFLFSLIMFLELTASLFCLKTLKYQVLLNIFLLFHFYVCQHYFTRIYLFVWIMHY